MRSGSTALAAFLDNETIATIRHLVTVTPRVGNPVHWTDHESDIPDPFGDVTVTYRAAGGLSGTHPIVDVGELDNPAGMEIGSLTLTLKCGEAASLNGVRLPVAAMNGALTGATVKILRYFRGNDGTWYEPMWWWEGMVGEVRPSSTVVEVDVESGIAALNVMLPRLVFGSGCSNMLYDAQCGLVVGTYTSACTVAASPAPTAASFSSTSSLGAPREVDGYFTLGVMHFTTGPLTGQSRAVLVHTFAAGAHAFTPVRSFSAAPGAGDAFTVYPGCDKTRETCDAKYANTARFRGFPFVPRNEAAL